MLTTDALAMTIGSNYQGEEKKQCCDGDKCNSEFGIFVVAADCGVLVFEFMVVIFPIRAGTGAKANLDV